MAKTKKELTKSNDKVVSGVFGGVAEYFGWDKAITRIIGAILIYFIAALVMPDQSKNTSATRRSGDDDSVIEGEFKEK